MVRAWSTRTGEAISPIPAKSSLLNKRFFASISGLHVSGSEELWIASGNTVERWELGRQSWSRAGS